jgi:transposase InsO family protein
VKVVQFIDMMRGRGCRVESVCRVLGDYGIQIAARTYRAFKARGPSKRDLDDAKVLSAMVHLRSDPDGAGRKPRERFYGRRKMTALLNRKGWRVSERTVGRLMRLANMQGLRRGRVPRTTIPAAKPGAGDLLDREFFAAAPNRRWVTDLTYVKARTQGWVYVSFITDLFSQKIVAWHVAADLSTQMVSDALVIALDNRRREGHPAEWNGLVHHSDHGSNYTSMRYGEQLANAGITPSFGSVGDALDNAVAEAVNSLYKAECVGPDGPFDTITQVQAATADWARWYNQDRLHSSLGHVPPDEIEAAYYDVTEPSPK